MPPEEKLSLQTRAYILAKTYAAVQVFFAHWQALPASATPEKVFHHILEKGLETEDRRAFGLVMMEYLAALHNGHTWYTDPWLNKYFGQPTGFHLRFLPEGWVVWKSDIPELRPGALVTHMEGQEAESFFQQHRKYIPASSERAARLSFSGKYPLFPLVLNLKLSDGREMTLDRSQSEAPRRQTEGHWLDSDDIAYIKIPSFQESRFEERAIHYLREFEAAVCIIIDVRGNGGGSTPGDLVHALMERPYRFYAESTAASFALFRANSELINVYGERLSVEHRAYLDASRPFAQSSLLWPAEVITPQLPVYSGKLIILTDALCASACEDFLLPFKDNHRATIIGETTLGSTGQPYIYRFDNEITIHIGAKRAFFPDGAAFEGVGIAPDIEVPVTLAALLADQDDTLEAALQYIRTTKLLSAGTE